jgi:serine/threonine protein phosphatase 1
MLKKLFGSKPVVPESPRAPADTRVYVIGDIHGRIDLLHQIHSQIRQDAATAREPRKVVVYLGDYVDRGDSSCQVIDLLLGEPLVGFEPVYLSGNHEEMMLGFLDASALGAMWLHNGGDATLFSYGVSISSGSNADQRYIAMHRALREKLPERHLTFLRGLRPYHVEGDYLFVHAGIRPGVPVDEQSSQDLLWIREEFLYSKEDHGCCVVHGHTIVSEPEFRANRIGIDTGAYFSNRLTCLVLEGTDQRTLHT